MTVVRACDIDFETRLHAALSAVRRGEVKPEEALAFVVWPSDTEVSFEEENLEEVKLCGKGLHPMTFANTVESADGCKRCRACQQEVAARRPKTGSHSKPQPCETCDGLCWPRRADGPRRCRACWKAQTKRKSLIPTRPSL